MWSWQSEVINAPRVFLIYFTRENVVVAEDLLWVWTKIGETDEVLCFWKIRIRIDE